MNLLILGVAVLVVAVVGEVIAQLVSQARLPLCSCGHPRAAHEHYRPGADCSQCPCREFRVWR